jgi:hypothetical protein
MNYNHFSAKGFFLPFLTWALLFLSAPAHALLDEGMYTESEKVGFAFCKIANITPDFSRWGRELELETVRPPNADPEDDTRLDRGFHSYLPDEDLIHIQLPVVLTTVDADRKNAKLARAGIVKIATISVEKQPSFYFPFQIADISIAMIPQEVESFTQVPLTAEQFVNLMNRVGLPKNWNGDINSKLSVEFQMRPTSVDIKKPVRLQGEDMWMMLAEVVTMSLWTPDHKKIVWEYTAPWYVTETSKELLDLYKN